MRRLIFTSRYIVAIIEGAKRATIRTRCRFQPGEQLVLCNGYRTDRDAFAEAELLSNDPLALADMDDELARADGFTDADALRAALAATYPGVEEFRLLRFRLSREIGSHPRVAAHRQTTRT